MNQSSNPTVTAGNSDSSKHTNESMQLLGNDFLIRSNKKLSDIISCEYLENDTILIKNKTKDGNEFFIFDKLSQDVDIQDLIVECPCKIENIYKEVDSSLLPLLQDSYCVSSEGKTYIIFKNIDNMKMFCIKFNSQKYAKLSDPQIEKDTIRLADFYRLTELDNYIFIESFKEYYIHIPFAQSDDEALNIINKCGLDIIRKETENFNFYPTIYRVKANNNFSIDKIDEESKDKYFPIQMIQISDASQRFESLLSNNWIFYPNTYKSSLTITFEVKNSEKNDLYVEDFQNKFIELIKYMNEEQKYKCVRISLTMYSVIYNQHPFTFYFDNYYNTHDSFNINSIRDKLIQIYKKPPILHAEIKADGTQTKVLPKLVEKQRRR